MILIIEGMDRCGKSTLVEQLRKTYFIQPQTIVFHASSPPRGIPDPASWEADHYRSLADQFFLMGIRGFDVILDRFHLGAIVYGQKYRNSDPTRIYQLDEGWGKWLGDEAALLLLTDYGHAINDRDDQDSLESGIADFEATRASFMEAFERSAIKHKLHINISENGGFTKTYPAVTEWLNKIREKQ